jgi:hypothetical protein
MADVTRLRGTTIALAAGGLVGALALAGCTSSPPPVDPVPTVDGAQPDRDRLAGLAALAEDRHFVATYTLTAPQRADRTITVASGTDTARSWVVGIPGGAMSGLANLAMYGTGPTSDRVVYQCSLGPVPEASTLRPDLTITPGCVKAEHLTAATDPRVQHLFTDWLDALVDRDTAISVAATALLPNATGTCFQVESTSAALTPPVDPGTYCFASDGLLTAAKVGFGTLTLAGAAQSAPATVAMPAPLTNQPLLKMVAPAPPPKPTPTPTPTPTGTKPAG